MEIVRHSGLPEKARPSIGPIINHYREMQGRMKARARPAQLRTELNNLRQEALALADHLAACFRDPDMYVAFIFSRRPPSGWPPRTGPVVDAVALQLLVSTLEDLRRLSDWIGLAQERVPHTNRGAQHQSQPAYVAAEFLNEILEQFAGRKVTRSTKRDDTAKYVKTVLRIADPNIGEGTMVEAIKKQIKWRKHRGEIAPSLPNLISPPVSRDNRQNRLVK